MKNFSCCLKFNYKWFRSAAASGNTDSAVNTFNGGSHAAAISPFTQDISAGFVQNQISKFGFGHGKTDKIAAGLFPQYCESLLIKQRVK